MSDELIHTYLCHDCGDIMIAMIGDTPEQRLASVRDHMRAHAITSKTTVEVVISREDVAEALDD